MIRLTRLSALALVGLALFASAPVYAQDSDQNDSSASSTSSDSDRTPTEFTDAQLKQFVTAQDNVQDTLKRWQDKVARADDKDAAKKKENDAMIKAVKSSGLTAKQYNAIAQQAQSDPKLTKRIQSFMTPQ